MSVIQPFREAQRVYCAGPLFNEPERQEMNQIADALRSAGFDPFVPHADGMEFAQLEPYLANQGCPRDVAGRVLHEAIFAMDVYQVILGCGSLVLNMNGRVPDEGAVAEATMAWTLGKPVIIFKADARSKIAGRDNPLIVGQTGFETIGKIEQLGEALSRRIGELALEVDWQVPCAPHMRETLSAGEQLWSRLTAFGAERPVPELAEVVWELFGPKEMLVGDGTFRFPPAALS
jgi:nucleoside 2-deoxyribosyltransferase